jgi:hypothetical protein
LWIFVVGACVWLATSFTQTSEARVPCLLISALPLIFDQLIGRQITRALVITLIVAKLYQSKTSYVDYAK